MKRRANITRLRELAHFVTEGREAVAREFTMRVPAEPERDADLVISTAADEIEALRAEVERLRAALGDPDGKGFYIASFKRTPGFVTWWRPDNAGYTPYLEQAGIYAADQIIADYHDAPDTVPVPVEFARRFVSRVVDIGHSGNKCWWSAKDLRAALAAMEATNAG